MRLLIELDPNDCLLIADLLRSRLMKMAKENQFDIDKQDVEELQKSFRKLSKGRDLNFGVIQVE